MYRFRLETLLRRRKQIEDMRQTELSAQRVEFEQASRSLEQVKLHRSEVEGKLKQKLTKRTTVADLITFQKFLHRLSDHLHKQKKVVATAQQKVDEKQVMLIDAMKSRKILDKLKEKESAAYGQQLMKKEQNFMNEIAGGRYVRSRMPVK